MNDQRGGPYLRVYGGRIDIGSFEQQPTVVVPGDFNRDHTVDAADYIVLRKQLGSNVPAGTGADANGDGLVDTADQAVWMANFGQTSVAPVGQVTVDQSAPPANQETNARTSSSIVSDGSRFAGVQSRRTSRPAIDVRPATLAQAAELTDQALTAWIATHAASARYDEHGALATDAGRAGQEYDKRASVTADAFDRVFAVLDALDALGE